MIPKEVKILHCADLHIGGEFSTLGDKAVQRRREVFHAFEKIITLCLDEKVDFLLIAGDLFDQINLENQIWTDLVSWIERIPETIVAIAPGNHDPFSADSWYYNRSWPKNVVIFQDELSYVLVEEKQVCLWGAGFRSTYRQDSFFNSPLPPFEEQWIHLGVMHGDLVSTGQTSVYNPITKEMIRNSPFDYLALGHIHKRSAIQKENGTFYSYSGSPEGHGFDEPGEQGVYIGTVSKGRCSLQFRRICNRCYLEVPVYITGLNTTTEITEAIRSRIREAAGSQAGENLYKVILEGEVPASFVLDPEGLSQRLSESVFYIKTEDHTRIAADYTALSGEQTLMGIFVRKMLEKIEDAEKRNDKVQMEKAQNALQYGLKAFEGEVTLREN